MAVNGYPETPPEFGRFLKLDRVPMPPNVGDRILTWEDHRPSLALVVGKKDEEVFPGHGYSVSLFVEDRWYSRVGGWVVHHWQKIKAKVWFWRMMWKWRPLR